MVTDLESDERSKWSLWAIAAAVLLVLLFGLIAFGTLRGCFYIDPQEAAEREEELKKKEEEKREFKIDFPAVQPSEAEAGLQYVKPGHWATSTQQMTANYRDFVGDSRTTVLGPQERPHPVTSTPFVLRASRPVLLTKGRPKATETTFFVPETDRAIRVETQLEERGLGYRDRRATTLNAMPSYQYHFVVLAKESSRYGFVKTLDSVRVPFGGDNELDDLEDTLHYRVALLPAGQSVPLPDNPLTWTTIGYLLWDEVDPQSFTPEQQRAVVDWLHWGGQLIVSGPGSLDLLKGSFLESYLPATNGGPTTIDADHESLAEINNAWMISTPQTRGEPLQPTAPWSAITLDLHEGAHALPGTGELFVERQVGRGRIVVSAVGLSERDLINWRSGFESLFNACLLRRPPREYRPGVFEGKPTLIWADENLKGRRLDARLTTRQRWLSRDLGVETAYRFEDVRDEFAGWGQPEVVTAYRPPAAAGGMGAWNDFSATAEAARQALREAAGVEVPGAGFVVFWLTVYLIALVPLNWAIFHTLGRVEWAWIAAPLIAVTGTIVIVNRAQLDIGFVRAQTEIALLEQQTDHARAHLSRYTGLYTSLSTTYDLEYANLTTLAAPFAVTADYQMLRGQGLQNVDFQRYDTVRLAGVPISSNSTGMVHSEQMMTLDGPIRLGRSSASGGRQIENHTGLELASVCVVYRPTREEAQRLAGPSRFEGYWIGRMLPGQSAPLPGTNSLARDKPAFADERAEEARLHRLERLNLEPMFRLALDPRNMEPGELRLVARIDEVLPGQKITPSASQVRGATLVVAHLQYAPLDPPRPDLNTKRDVKHEVDDPLEFEF